MKAATIRFVDAWVGVPACAVMTLWRWLFDRRDGRGPVRRVLFLKLVEQGATVLACPALRRAVERVGAENVFFLVLAENRPILDLVGLVPPENIVAVPTGGLWTTITGLLAAVGRLRRERIDGVFDFEFFARAPAVISYLTGAGRRVGYHRFHGDGPWRGDLLTHRLVYNPHMHTQPAMVAMVEALWQDPAGLPALDVPTGGEALAQFEPSPEEFDRVAATIRRETGGRDVGRLVLLNANASDLLPLRRWESDRYLALARRLLGDFPDIHVAFTGAPSERPAVDALVAAVADPRCFSMAGRTTLRELMVLYCRADVLVTNDSGPAHFAALTPIEVVTLFGPETPRLFGVLGPRSHVIWKQLPCSPCVSAYNGRLSPCRDNLCMQAIGVEEVLGVVRGILERRGRSDT